MLRQIRRIDHKRLTAHLFGDMVDFMHIASEREYHKLPPSIPLRFEWFD